MLKQQIIKKLKLQIQIAKIRLQILLLRKKLTVPNLPAPEFIIIHHEGANNGFKIVNEWHKKRWGFKSSLGYYCGYQIYIDKQLRIYQARSNYEEGAHCPGHNKDSIGVCIQGDYSKEVLDFRLEALLVQTIDKLRAKYNISKKNVLGDKEGRVWNRPTQCPAGLMSWVEKYRN